MRSFLVGASVTLLALALGCGKSEPDSSSPAAAGQTAAGRDGTAGVGASGMGGQSAGSPSGGKPSGAGAGTSGGSDSGGGLTGDGGEGASGGGGLLVSCDPKKVSCKRAAPQCAPGEVPSVVGNCYGECVKIERCACSDAEQCPEPNQYTCWARQHCGPFVR